MYEKIEIISYNNGAALRKRLRNVLTSKEYDFMLKLTKNSKDS